MQMFLAVYVENLKIKMAQMGWLLGIDQLAGLYFDVFCQKCGKKKQISYESKSFGKTNMRDYFFCCGSVLDFSFHWAH